MNVTGSFLLGLLASTAPPAATVLGTGALGAYTTFSGFARDIVAAIEQRGVLLAAGYLTATCILGVAAAAAGLALSTW